MKIYKYKLERFTNDVEVCKGSVFLHVGKDPKGQHCIWCAVPEDEYGTQVWTIVDVFTGHEIPYLGKYLGTVVDGELVHHYYLQ